MKKLLSPALMGIACLALFSGLTNAWAGSTVQFRTILGDIDVELYADKPATTRNFLNYVDTSAYGNTVLHRWVANFIVQGGGYYLYYIDGFGYFPIGVASLGTITNEFNVGRRLSNIKGTLAMAKTSLGPDTATCEWFFNLADNSTNLDNQNGGFTVFGQVVGGMEVLERFNQTNAANNLYICDGCTNLSTAFDTMPLYSTDGLSGDFLYVDITSLKVKVAPGTNVNTMDITWNSRSNRVNVVECSALTNYPPTWQSLWRTNGTGAAMKYTDRPPAGTGKFYRVRVEY
jgi:cyclophilin family peptidyl-prolyl cis-trans isomerase